MQKESKYKYLMSAADSCLYLSKMTYGLKKNTNRKKSLNALQSLFYLTWIFFRLYINIYRIQKRFKNIKCDLCIVRFYRYKHLVYFSRFSISSQYVIFCLCVFPLHPLFLMITLDCVRKGWLIYDLKCTKHINIMITIINICIVMISFFFGKDKMKKSYHC